jgi:hypothetical protein
VRRALRTSILVRQIEFWKSSDGLNWQGAGLSFHLTVARPFIVSATSSSIEFSHVGTDSNRTLNLNTHSY